MDHTPSFFRRRMNKLTGEVGASLNEMLILMGTATLVVAATASSGPDSPTDNTRRTLIVAGYYGGGSASSNSNDGSTLEFGDRCLIPTGQGFAPFGCQCRKNEDDPFFLLPCDSTPRHHTNPPADP